MRKYSIVSIAVDEAQKVLDQTGDREAAEKKWNEIEKARWVNLALKAKTDEEYEKCLEVTRQENII